MGTVIYRFSHCGAAATKLIYVYILCIINNKDNMKDGRTVIVQYIRIFMLFMLILFCNQFMMYSIATIIDVLTTDILY